MTDKELHKLGRRELLQLLLAQGREAEKAKAKLQEVQEELTQLEEGYERLKNRLNDKDAQILQLRENLQAQRQGQGAPLEDDLGMDFAQVRGSMNGPASPSVPAPYTPKPTYVPPAWSAPAPSKGASPAGKRPRHAQGGGEASPPAQRDVRPRGPVPGVMEVVQVVGGKLQPQSRMLLRPQRVEKGT